MRVKHTSRAGGFEVSATGRGIEGHAGLGLAVEVADRVGLTDALCDELAGARGWAEHEPGVVARDLVAMLCDGGKSVSDLARYHPVIFGHTASQPTAWRTIEAVAGDELARGGLGAAVARARGWVWSLPGGAPPALDGDAPLCVDLDATLVTAHSEKDRAAGTYKGGYGFHPILAFADRGDGTGEALAGLLRPGNAPAHTAADNIEVFDQALNALPALPADTKVVVRGDSALATKAFLDYVGQADCRFSVSFELSEPVRAAIRAVGEQAWQPATYQDGAVRERAHVAELTTHLALADGWPESARLLVRREPLHPGAQQTFDDIDGYRFTCVLTDQTDADIVALERRHRARARAEDRIRCLKTVGLGNLPCGDFDRNAVWLALALAALTLLTWTQTLTLDGDLARAEPERLRYQLWHTAARITRSARRYTVAFQADWNSTADLVAAFTRLRALPLPAT